jgi:hypothetical protein
MASSRVSPARNVAKQLRITTASHPGSSRMEPPFHSEEGVERGFSVIVRRSVTLLPVSVTTSPPAGATAQDRDYMGGYHSVPVASRPPETPAKPPVLPSLIMPDAAPRVKTRPFSEAPRAPRERVHSAGGVRGRAQPVCDR